MELLDSIKIEVSTSLSQAVLSQVDAVIAGFEIQYPVGSLVNRVKQLNEAEKSELAPLVELRRNQLAAVQHKVGKYGFANKSGFESALRQALGE